MLSKNRAWAEANPEKVKAIGRSYHARNRQLSRQKSKAWRDANKSLAYELTRAWAQANPDKVRSYNQSRRASIASLEHDGSTTADVLDHYGRTCYLCESWIPEGTTPDIDHMVPHSKGGPWTLENLRPTHPSCNRSKSDKLLTELELPFPQPTE